MAPIKQALTLKVQSSILPRAAKKISKKCVYHDEPHNWHIYQLLHLYLVVNYIRIVLYLDQILFIYVLGMLSRILFHKFWL